MAFDLEVPLVKGGKMTIKITESRNKRLYKYRSVFTASYEAKHNLVYANFINKGDAPWTGTDSVNAIVLIAKKLNAHAVYLQDASHIWCDDSTTGYTLTFRSILETGKTWYERQGFVLMEDAVLMPKRRINALRKTTETWMKRFKSISVSAVAESIAAQIKSVGNKSSPVVTAFGQKKRVQDYKYVMRHRKKLLVMLTAARSKTLGSWLPTLSCKDYAYFMWAMYGHWWIKNPAVAKVNGTKTVSVLEFTKANSLGNQPLYWILTIRYST